MRLTKKIIFNKCNKFNFSKKRFHKPIYIDFEEKLNNKFKKENLNIVELVEDLKKINEKKINEAVKDSKIKPYNDFYSYVNIRWLNDKKNTIGYLTKFDDFRIVQNDVYNKLVCYFNHFIKKNNRPKLAFQMKSFLNSFLNVDKKIQEKESTLYIKKMYLDKIDELYSNHSENNLWKILGFLNKFENFSFGCPLVWKINPDPKNPTIYKSNILPSTLTLPNILVYLDNKNPFEKQYNEYINNLFILQFGKEHSYDPNDIWYCERQMALGFAQLNPLKDDDKLGYFNLNSKELKNKLGINWDEISKNIGFSTTPNQVIVSSPEYFSYIIKLLKLEWFDKKWKTYFIYLFLRNALRFTKRGHQISFDFISNVIEGLDEKIPPSLYFLFIAQYAFPNFFNNEYIKYNNNIEYIKYVEGLSKDLKLVFKRIIEGNKWLSANTKKMALLKLQYFKFNIGSKYLPEKEISDGIVFSDTNLIENIHMISLKKLNYLISLNNKAYIDIPTLDWSKFPIKTVGAVSYIVNAAYTPFKNGIDMPLGFIQKPFINLDGIGLEYNLAHMGYTLGHEMSHSLDDWGSKYNEKGVLVNWWTPEDKKNYKKIQDNVLKQYESFAKEDGIVLDAQSSLGEDLADISGIGICISYLADFQMKNKDVLIIKKISFETFFVYYALHQRQRISKSAMRFQLLTNPHPPDKYRTNIPLSRVEVFRKIYNVKKKDKMWWENTNLIWN
jgi:putative endopeptidase